MDYNGNSIERFIIMCNGVCIYIYYIILYYTILYYIILYYIILYIYIIYMSYCTKIVARWPRWSQRLAIWDRGKIRGRKGATRDIDWNTTSVGGRARIHRWCPLLLLGWHPKVWISKWRTAPTDVWLVNFSTGHVSGKWWYLMVHRLYYIWLLI